MGVKNYDCEAQSSQTEKTNIFYWFSHFIGVENGGPEGATRQ